MLMTAQILFTAQQKPLPFPSLAPLGNKRGEGGRDGGMHTDIGAEVGLPRGACAGGAGVRGR